MNAPDLPKRRLLTAKRLAASILISLLVLGGLWWCFNPWSLSRQLADLRSQGLPTNLEELDHYYAVPPGAADTTGQWVTVIDAVEKADFLQKANTLPIIGSNPSDVPTPGQPWAELEASREFLRTVRPELELAWKAADAGGHIRFPEQYAADINGTVLRSSKSRQVSRLLQLHAHVSAHDGIPADSLRDVKAVFTLSEALRGEPLLVATLIRIAVYGSGCALIQELAPHSQWSESDIAALQTLAGKADFKAEFIRALNGERAYSLSLIDKSGFGPLTNPQKTAMLEVFQKAIDDMALDWQGVIKQHQALGEKLDAKQGFSGWRYFLVQLTFPYVEQASKAGSRAAARQRTLVAMLAARRFQIQHGRMPDSLQEIEPELFGEGMVKREQMTDPFDGQPLRFLKKEGRIVIYSLGEDGVDDGGQITTINQKPPLDAGFELR